jgi:hypothetical protein
LIAPYEETRLKQPGENMSNSNYTLEIVSHHPDFNGKTLKQFYVDGINTVGSFEEEFEIRFKNNTNQKVQVKLSLDGTDIFTGKKADTQVSKDMWVVNAYATLSLKAWPENSQGGAAFIFTSANNSVAVHTHGDLSSRGIIAAAVFIESQPTVNYTYPIVINQPYYVPVYPPYYYQNNPWYDYTVTCSGKLGSSSSTIVNDVSCITTNNSCYFDGDVVVSTVPLEQLVSVGAGQNVSQHIKYVAGLNKPVFTETVRVRYVWWNELQEKLRNYTVVETQPSGFPGDNVRGINLGNTPRLGHQKRIAQTPMSYSRV